MKHFTRKFERIKGLKPTLRGFRLERLFHEIFEENGILLERSFKNTDGSQQIDGAIEINNRIFIVEIKWENSKTLAASKLYSFLWKINSKIDGTLGLFISYDELQKNFLDSARGGIKQNCIIIHGEENILPVIRGEASITEYIWYLYQQASTKNRITVPFSEFISIPRKTIKARRTSANDKWKEVYDALVSENKSGDFELKLIANYDQIDDLTEKTIILYPILQNIPNIYSKIDYLLNTIISHEEDKVELYNSLVRMLISSHWIKYANEHLLDKT
jgi:hypothetical protein